MVTCMMVTSPQHSNHFDRVSPHFSFCNWNLNTLSKDEFFRVSLINAHNSIHNYDISLCETSLSNSEFVPDNILQGYCQPMRYAPNIYDYDKPYFSLTAAIAPVSSPLLTLAPSAPKAYELTI